MVSFQWLRCPILHTADNCTLHLEVSLLPPPNLHLLHVQGLWLGRETWWTSSLFSHFFFSYSIEVACKEKVEERQLRKFLFDCYLMTWHLHPVSLAEFQSRVSSPHALDSTLVLPWTSTSDLPKHSNTHTFFALKNSLNTGHPRPSNFSLTLPSKLIFYTLNLSSWKKTPVNHVHTIT